MHRTLAMFFDLLIFFIIEPVSKFVISIFFYKLDNFLIINYNSILIALFYCICIYFNIYFLFKHQQSVMGKIFGIKISIRSKYIKTLIILRLIMYYMLYFLIFKILLFIIKEVGIPLSNIDLFSFFVMCILVLVSSLCMILDKYSRTFPDLVCRTIVSFK